MTPLEYRTALTTLGLTQQAAGRWLRVSPKTAQNYAKHGPSGPAAVAVEMRLALMNVQRVHTDGYKWREGHNGPFVLYEELEDALSAALKGEAG